MDEIPAFLAGLLIGLFSGFIVISIAVNFDVRIENIVAAAVACDPMGGLKTVGAGNPVSVVCNNGVKLEFKSVVQEN